jgi:uncharacterized linocin/CFP29 family protein
MIHQVGVDIPQAAMRFVRVTNGVPQVDRRLMWSHFVENNTLREDSTREIDEALVRVARRDLRAVAAIRSLRKNLTKGIGATTYEYDKITPVGEATQGMSILNLGDRDLVTFSRTAIPVPVTASQFRMDARQLASGRGMGESVDLTNIEEHTRSVSEKLEDTLINGSSVVLGANTLPGFTNFSCRQAITFSDSAWSSLTPATFTSTVTDVLAARTALRDDGFTGPYVLAIPPNFDGVMDEDFKAESDRTVRERLMAIDGVERIEVWPALVDSNVLLVQLTRSVVEMPVGQDITVVTWDEYGGLATNWAIIAVLTFALKCANARAPLSNGTLPTLTTGSGIAHIS